MRYFSPCTADTGRITGFCAFVSRMRMMRIQGRCDPCDAPFLVFAANAAYLVTNDRHSCVLKKTEFPQVMTCTAQQFLQLLNVDE
jgi:predicted nucleic acid-binding protein